MNVVVVNVRDYRLADKLNIECFFKDTLNAQKFINYITDMGAFCVCNSYDKEVEDLDKYKEEIAKDPIEFAESILPLLFHLNEFTSTVIKDDKYYFDNDEPYIYYVTNGKNGYDKEIFERNIHEKS